MNDAIEPRPARPLRPRVEIDSSGESLGLCYRHREWAGGGFLVVWLIGWTVACVFLGDLVMREPKLGNFLFAMPFWASWLFVFAMVLKTFCQRETFSLDPAGATFSRHVLVELKRRETPLQEIKRFDIYERIVDDESRRTESGLEMKTLGLSLEFAAGLDQPELLWLQGVLQEQLADLRERFHVEPPVDDTNANDSTNQSNDRFDSNPPSDCSWRREDDFDALAFKQAGRFSWSVIAILLFVNAFWNGIVSVFICLLCGVMDGAPQGAEWRGLLFFLIPFEAIGLVMFAGLILALLEPIRRTSWRIDRSDITCRLVWLGIGPTWEYPIEHLDRIRVENKEPKPDRRARQLAPPWKSTGATFRLSLVDASNCEVCSIDNLTEGESHWMAAVIRAERPLWFR